MAQLKIKTVNYNTINAIDVDNYGLVLAGDGVEFAMGNAVTAAGAKASATTTYGLYGFIAPDTGATEGNYGKHLGGTGSMGEPNSIVRCFTKGIVMVDTELNPGDIVRLGADGFLETAGTGKVVGLAINTGEAKTKVVRLDINMSEPNTIA